MSFATRNAYYLRVSNYRVIPLFLYLDERHIDWMSERVLRAVIEELQPKVKSLMSSARPKGKQKVYVERGEGYQYCYFLRVTTRTEVVLIKQKEYSLRPPTPPLKPVPSPSPKNNKSSRSAVRPRDSRSRSRSISLRPIDDSGMNDGNHASGMNDGDDEDVKPDVEEDEVNIKDYKPDVALSYTGFGTSSLQLVLIIEPYPPLPSSEYAPPSSRLSTRSASVMSSSRSRTFGSRTVGAAGQSGGARYSSVSLALDQPSTSRQPVADMRNMRNASKSQTPLPASNSRRGGSSVTPFGASPTPGASPFGTPAPGLTREETPLFLPRGQTPSEFGFDPNDEEDEEAHDAYLAAVREGRIRLPSITRPAGQELEEMTKSKSKKRIRRKEIDEEEEQDLDDEPEGMEVLGERLLRNSEIEEGVVRLQGGWEDGVEDDVVKEEPSS